MPYLLPPSQFTTRVSLVIETQRLFRLTSPFAYRLPAVPSALVEPLTALGAKPVDGGGMEIAVPAFDETAAAATQGVGQTDLASIPPMLWSMIGPYGRHLLAALVHDFLCQRATSFDTRAAADFVFWEACGDDERLDAQSVPAGAPRSSPLPRSPWTRRVMLWAGVSFGRLWEYRKGSLGWLLLALAGGVVALSGLAGWWGRTGDADAISPDLWWIGGLALTLAAVAAMAALKLPGVWGTALSALCRLAGTAAGGGVVVGVAGLLARRLADRPDLDGPLGGPSAWLGVAALLSGSLMLTVGTPTKRDGWLPVIGLLASPVLLPVVVVTVFAQCLLWVPDALAIAAPAWTAPGPVGFGPLRRRLVPGYDLPLLDQ